MICQGDNDPIIDAICNDLFEINRNWYAGEEINDNHSIYQPPPLDDVWLDESGRHERKDYLVEQKQRNSDRVCRNEERICSEIDVIPLNTSDSDFPFQSGPVISEDDVSDDSFVRPHSESEGDFGRHHDSPFANNGDDLLDNSTLEGVTPSLSPEGATPIYSLDGAQQSSTPEGV